MKDRRKSDWRNGNTDCEVKKRRIGVWRKRGIVYVSLRGDCIWRNKVAAIDQSRIDEAWITSCGGDTVFANPPIPPKPHRTLTDWLLPNAIAARFERVAQIKQLYEWQDDCLRQACGQQWGSVIYSAPTSGGKSLVADLILLRRLLFSGKRALVVCPFVSICRERANFLRSVLGVASVVVEEFHGAMGKPWNPGVDIAVCTVQKAIQIFNTIVAGHDDTDTTAGASSQEDEGPFKKKFSDLIGTVVVDEFHLAIEQSPSAMESFVSRVNLLPDRDQVVVVGMSATMAETDRAKLWMSSAPRTVAKTVPCLWYESGYSRPVALDIFVKRNEYIFPLTGDAPPTPIPVVFDKQADSDLFASLVMQSLGVSTVVFCATRNWCENAVQMLTKLLLAHPSPPEEPNDRITARRGVLEALQVLAPCGLNPVLAASIMVGVAYHHAGLTSEERCIIETAFREKAIHVLCATSTLSAGVNLPAERVILRTLSAATGGAQNVAFPALAAKMKQMVGRAGRAGMAAKGEAVIMCTTAKEEGIVRAVFAGTEMPAENRRQSAVAKQATADTVSLVRAMAKEILEILAVWKQQVANRDFFQTTFIAAKLGTSPDHVSEAIAFLSRNKLISIVMSADEAHGGPSSSIIIPTRIGDALGKSSMPLDEAEQTFRELNLARQKLCLSGDDLHLLYLVTPPVTVSESEFEEFCNSTGDMFSVPEVKSILGTSAVGESVGRRKRMMVALMLRELMRADDATTIATVAKKYKVQTGTVQYLQSTAATYCAMVSSFCEHLGWTSLAAALQSIKPKLMFGVPESLLGLVEVEGVSAARARALAKAGLTTVEKVANANSVRVAMILAGGLDVVPSTQTAQHLLESTSKLIIRNARVKLGLSETTTSFAVTTTPTESEPVSSITASDLFSPMSAPLLHQLIGTQPEQDSEDEDSLPSNVSLVDPTLPPNLSVVDSTTNSPDMLEDALLLSVLEGIDEHPVIRRSRRISEMTTVDAREPKRTRATIVSEDDGVICDSLILRAIDFNSF